MRGKFHHHASFLVLAALFLFEAALLLVSCNQNATFGCVESERQALLKFKACFFDSSSNMLSSWKGNDCCEWKGVGCDKHSNHVVLLALRGTINDFGTPVKRLYLNSSVDDVASSLASLRFLEHLDLSRNSFRGNNIPQSIGLMEHLRYLNLSYAAFGGEIPHQLGNLTRLCILDLGNNYWNGVWVRDIRWMSQLRSLQQLDMSAVDLSSVTTSPNVFQVLNNLASLTTLKLSECGLTVSLLSLGNYPFNSSFLGNIKVLDLSHNSINGPVPAFISNMTSLEFLDLSSNSINGHVPAFISNMTSLEFLDLSSSQLTGDIPNNVGHIAGLEYLDLAHNHLNGSIPDSIGQLSKLETLDLSSNQLTGTIPGSIGQLSKLETLALFFNQLIGAIPASIGYLSRLETLDLSSNQLTGEIPESIGQLFNLKTFAVYSNSLEGVVSEAHFASLSKLTYLDIGLNRLNCELKCDWRPSFHLRFMSINSCKLGTRFPKWIQSQNTIEYLDLSNTSISGPIPENIGYMMPNLAVLNLADNNINGSIPESLGNLQTLELLDISNNTLSGNIPNSFDQLIDLEILFLNNNNLSGELPVTLANCNRLAFLNLGENALSGNITLIGESHFYLEVLRL